MILIRPGHTGNSIWVIYKSPHIELFMEYDFQSNEIWHCSIENPCFDKMNSLIFETRSFHHLIFQTAVSKKKCSKRCQSSFFVYLLGWKHAWWVVYLCNFFVYTPLYFGICILYLCIIWYGKVPGGLLQARQSHPLALATEISRWWMVNVNQSDMKNILATEILRR